MSTEIVEFNEFEANLAEYKAQYEGVVYDLSDGKQLTTAKKDRLAIGKTISALDKVHKTVKEPLFEKVKLLDGERKRIKDGLLDIQGGIKDQITEHEARIEAVDMAFKNKAGEVRELYAFESPPSLELVKERLDAIIAVVIDEDTYGPYVGYAAMHKDQGRVMLEPMLAGLEAQAKADAEAEQTRIQAEKEAQEAREAQIAKDAKEAAEKEAAAREAKAKADAEAAIERERLAKEKAEQDAKDAEERQEQARKDAEDRARIAAAEALEREKAAAIAAEERVKQEAADNAAAQKAADEKRAANKRHSKKINNEAAAGFVEGGFTKEQAQEIVTLIAQRKIQHVAISY